MVIAFLQHEGILPYLQTKDLAGMSPLKPVMVEGCNVSFHADVEALRAAGHLDGAAANTQTAGQLLAGFFHYFAFEFDFDHYVVCVRHAKPLHRDATTFKEELCVEDPFLLAHNTSKTARGRIVDTFFAEFTSAYELLVCQASGKLEALFDKSDLQ
eukprot:Unigene11133_Nuclearia_a/m.34073 Unigene11133_Nuclearia_a/g.34073  ORF Unigene11133_Nuclearia_a/g.34073 Unigene11133_Nuclearia_a/m.34073 type:complete len:156 (-) Unigene11133_Nuclearia_a:52-519(-)